MFFKNTINCSSLSSNGRTYKCTTIIETERFYFLFVYNELTAIMDFELKRLFEITNYPCSSFNFQMFDKFKKIWGKSAVDEITISKKDFDVKYNTFLDITEG